MKTRRNVRPNDAADSEEYFQLVRVLERARERNVKDWAAAVVRNSTARQRRELVAALVDGFGPLKLLTA